MLQFLSLQFKSFYELITSGFFTSSFAFLIYSIHIGPLFSIMKIDEKVWNFFSTFDTKYNEYNYRLFNAFDVILDGASWWLAINEICFQPEFNWRFLFVISVAFFIKFVFGRQKPIKNGPPEPLLIKDLTIKYNYDPFKKDLSKNDSNNWQYFWKRENSFNLKNIFNDYFKWSYPSTQIIVLLSLVFFGQKNIEIVILLICGIIWKMISNRNWLSDILSSIFLIMFFNQVL